MILRDFECDECGSIREKIVDSSLEYIRCVVCDGGLCKKIITAGRTYLGNDSVNWIPSVLEVVDKESNDPHTKEFIKDPTRTNYRAWMKSTGLRPFEPGEKPNKPEGINETHVVDELMKMRRERHRLEVR